MLTRVLLTRTVGTHRRDRGDVPGWVLITVMTAGIVAALMVVAGPTLVDMFKAALANATGKKP
ncbi:MAG TPA: hypothetical protein P5181_10020 [Dermatophilaceae bacterium]|nr:hypothetical protein [Dermatophilaceae bacterium]